MADGMMLDRTMGDRMMKIPPAAHHSVNSFILSLLRWQEHAQQLTGMQHAAWRLTACQMPGQQLDVPGSDNQHAACDITQ